MLPTLFLPSLNYVPEIKRWDLQNCKDFRLDLPSSPLSLSLAQDMWIPFQFFSLLAAQTFIQVSD
jgi:hypothetical protein